MFSLNRLKILFIFLFAVLPGISRAQTPGPELIGPVTLESAVDWAIDRDPHLKLLEAEIEVVDGQMEQAGLRPNPVIAAEFENILGTDAKSGIHGMEVTLGVSQIIETAGKRDKRSSLAESQRALADWNIAMRQADLEVAVREAFIAIIIGQETLELRREQLVLAEWNLAETKERVKSTRSPLVEQTRAQLEVSRQRFSLEKADREGAAARNRLAAFWGYAPAPEFSVAGKVSIEPVPGLDILLADLPQTIFLARFAKERAAREAALELEEARARPDFEVFGGARYFNEDGGDIAFVAGFEMPWPLYDKNQGKIRITRAHLQAVELERETANFELRQKLGAFHSDMTGAYADAMALKEDLLPVAEQTLMETREGYERGQFTQLVVLERRQALFEIREAFLDALNRYAIAHSGIQALTALSK